MKTIINVVKERLRDEAAAINLLENDVNVYQCIFEDDISIMYVGKCNKCKKMVHLEHMTLGETCITLCLECGPKKCVACNLYHMEEGVQEFKEKQAKRRKKKRRIILG